MGLFGKKNNDKDNKDEGKFPQGDDLDALIMSAIEETDLEQAQAKEQARKNEAERVARMTEELNAAEEMKVKRVLRSFLMVTASEREDDIFRFKGTLHGQFKEGDTVYVYHPNGTALEALIKDIEIEDDTDGQEVDMMKGQVVRISVTFVSDVEGEASPEAVAPFYSVVTNVKPPVKDDKKAPVENPYLLGLTLEYPNYMKDKEYMRLLIKYFAEGRFIVPIHPVEKDKERDKPVLRLITIKKSPEDNDIKVPLFTDVAALASWKELIQREGKPSVAVLPFSDLAKLTAKESPDFVVNSSGPLTINLPRQVVDNIAGLVRNVSGDPNGPRPRVAVGVPPKNDETDNIRKALVEFARETDSIKALGYIATIREGGKKGYACVVDCPKEGAKDLFQQMADKVKPFMKEIRSMEFIIRSDAGFADTYFSKIPYDYQE